MIPYFFVSIGAIYRTILSGQNNLLNIINNTHGKIKITTINKGSLKIIEINKDH